MSRKVSLTRRRRVRYWRSLSFGRPAWERLVLAVGRLEVSLVSLPFTGWFATATRRDPGAPWVRIVVPNLQEFDVKRIEIGKAVEGGSASHLAPVESDLFARLMSLVSHCSVTRYEDGAARQPGWFQVKTLGSSWVVQIKDPDSCASLQAIGATLDDALTLAELLLSSESAPWEHDRYLAQQKAAKKK